MFLAINIIVTSNEQLKRTVSATRTDRKRVSSMLLLRRELYVRAHTVTCVHSREIGA